MKTSETRSEGARKVLHRRTNFVFRLASILVIAPLILAPGVAGAGSKDSPHCVIGQDDLNEIFGTEDGFVVSPFCTEVATGARWRPIQRWDASGSWTYAPDGYDTSGGAPLEHFLATFEAARYVVDAGTRQERSYDFGPEDLNLLVVDVPDGPHFAAWAPRLSPLPPGTHTVDVYVTFSDMLCDGISPGEGGICVPEGESLVESVEFVVRSS